MTTVYIYGLVCPNTKKIRYVGRTKKLLKARLAQHTSCKQGGAKYLWIQRTKRSGMAVSIVLLETVRSKEEATICEGKWCKHYEELGYELFNIDYV